MYSKTVTLLILLFTGVYTAQTQNVDPHGNDENAITGMPSTAILLVMDVAIRDSIEYQEYRMKVAPIIKDFGGTFIVRSGGMAFEADPARNVVMIEGGWSPDRFIIIEWESMSRLEAFMNSEAYKSIEHHRKNSANMKSIIVKKYINN